MGIESDQLVDDYLSRVGDLAQQRQLPPSDRDRLVSTLRNEIDRRRATNGEESPAAVRGILGALGTPDEVVRRADDGTPVPPPRSEGPGPVRPRPPSPPPPKPSRSSIPKPSRSSSPKPSPSSSPVPTPRKGDGPPGTGMDPDWWRTDALNATDVDVTDGLPGFVGGIEKPELFEPPAPEDDEEFREDEEAALSKWRRGARFLLRRKAAPAPDPGPEAAEEPEVAAPARARLANPFVLLAALLLLGGAVFGSLVALAAGWLLAYASRRLTPGEVKGAVVVIPGLAAATGVVWLWGRVEGRWGDPVGPGGEAMGAAISETWPWALRGAAVASALFLLWRSRRH